MLKTILINSFIFRKLDCNVKFAVRTCAPSGAKCARFAPFWLVILKNFPGENPRTPLLPSRGRSVPLLDSPHSTIFKQVDTALPMSDCESATCPMDTQNSNTITTTMPKIATITIDHHKLNLWLTEQFEPSKELLFANVCNKNVVMIGESRQC